MHIHAYTCIYMHIHAFTCIYIHTYTYIYVHTHTNKHTYIQTYIHTNIHTYKHTYVRTTYIHTYTYIHAHMQINMYLHIYLNIQTQIHIHRCIYVHIHTYIHMHLYIYIYTYTYNFVYRLFCFLLCFLPGRAVQLRGQRRCTSGDPLAFHVLSRAKSRSASVWSSNFWDFRWADSNGWKKLTNSATFSKRSTNILQPHASSHRKLQKRCYMSVQILFFAAVQVGVADWQPQLCGVSAPG